MSSATINPAVSEEPWYDPEIDKVRAERKLGKSGNSTVLRIPPGMLRSIGVEQGDMVDVIVDADNGQLIIRPAD